MNIENSNYKLTFVEEGAQLSSWIDKKDSHEFIHNGIQGWKQQNPTLFPIVGKLVDGSYTIDGKEYAMGQHGVVRRAKFTCVNKTENSICFEFQSNEESLEHFPYSFTFQKEYHLEENRLIVSHRVINTDTKDFPFSIGHHPAFACDFSKNPKVVFEKSESMEVVAFDEHGYFTHETTHYKGEQASELAMPFDKKVVDTLVFTNLQSSFVSLVEENHAVRVSAVGFPYFAIWYNEEGFICLEPWLSHSSFADTPKELAQKEEMNVLESGHSFLNTYVIEVQ